MKKIMYLVVALALFGLTSVNVHAQSVTEKVHLDNIIKDMSLGGTTGGVAAARACSALANNPSLSNRILSLAAGANNSYRDNASKAVSCSIEKLARENKLEEIQKISEAVKKNKDSDLVQKISEELSSKGLSKAVLTRSIDVIDGKETRKQKVRDIVADAMNKAVKDAKKAVLTIKDTVAVNASPS